MKVGYTSEPLTIEFSLRMLKQCADDSQPIKYSKLAKVSYDNYDQYFRAIQNFDTLFTARFSSEWHILATKAINNGYKLVNTSKEVERYGKSIYISPDLAFIAIKNDRITMVYDEKEIESYAK